MKIRKYVLAWIGIILATPVSNLFALLPLALFISFVVILGADQTKATDNSSATNWPLSTTWVLVVLSAVATVVIGILFNWWILIPLAFMFVSLAGIAYLVK